MGIDTPKDPLQPHMVEGEFVHCPTCPCFVGINEGDAMTGQCRAHPPTIIGVPKQQQSQSRIQPGPGPQQIKIGMEMQSWFPIVNAKSWCAMHPLFALTLTEGQEENANA